MGHRFVYIARINEEHADFSIENIITVIVIGYKFVENTTLRSIKDWRIAFSTEPHTHRGKNTPLPTNEASDGKRPPRSAAATGRMFFPA